MRVEDYPHLKDVELADFDPNLNDDKSIDILVGADYYWQFVTGEVVRGSDGPTAMSSKLGWLLSGYSPKTSAGDSTINNLILVGECIDNSRVQTDHDDELMNVLKQFWERALASNPSNSKNETRRSFFQISYLRTNVTRSDYPGRVNRQ